MCTLLIKRVHTTQTEALNSEVKLASALLYIWSNTRRLKVSDHIVSESYLKRAAVFMLFLYPYASGNNILLISISFYYWNIMISSKHYIDFYNNNNTVRTVSLLLIIDSDWLMVSHKHYFSNFSKKTFFLPEILLLFISKCVFWKSLMLSTKAYTTD